VGHIKGDLPIKKEATASADGMRNKFEMIGRTKLTRGETSARHEIKEHSTRKLQLFRIIKSVLRSFEGGT